ncbi:MAG: putative Se/S carrier-like protein [Dissulfuribacterales bacterium]
MKILDRIKQRFGPRKKEALEKGKGLIILNEVSEAMQAEKILKRFGYGVRGVAPPPEIRKGCDLAVEFNLVDQLGVERLLKKSGLNPLDIVALDNLSQRPLDITKEKAFGRYLMVTAANMKITVDKEKGTIVNISGGGCPDVPYLTVSLVGNNITEVENPGENGYSLCAYMLEKAYQKALSMVKSEQTRECT